MEKQPIQTENTKDESDNEKIYQRYEDDLREDLRYENFRYFDEKTIKSNSDKFVDYLKEKNQITKNFLEFSTR